MSEFRPSRPGERRGGRKKGTPNKTTKLLKDALMEAADAAGGKEGLVGYLTNLARKHPSVFATLLGKLLPLQAHVTGNTGSAVTNVFIPSLDVMDAAERYARLLRGEDVGAPALPSRRLAYG
jgi:hypothetical protein